jgi:phosphoribosyl-AMP cyclohydrolase
MADDIETGTTFQPRFDGQGLIGAIVTDAGDGAVLMFAWMNETALTQTLQTGIAHFWSRSRHKLWRKGEESGNELAIVEIRTDCDQDALVVRVQVRGQGVACHTGARSCFYRSVVRDPATGTVSLRRTSG